MQFTYKFIFSNNYFEVTLKLIQSYKQSNALASITKDFTTRINQLF